MPAYMCPGLYREDIRPSRTREAPSGIPAFIGLGPDRSSGPRAGRKREISPCLLTHWEQFAPVWGGGNRGFLPYAVRGFFENGGPFCYLVEMSREGDREAAFARALAAVDLLADVDLVCAPDLFWVDEGEALDLAQATRLQSMLVHGGPETGRLQRSASDRFNILDSSPDADWRAELGHVQDLIRESDSRGADDEDLADSALYYPWIDVPGIGSLQGFGGAALAGKTPNLIRVPPCGHVAGVFARTAKRDGAHRAPANRIVEGVLDLAVSLNDEDQSQLFERAHEAGVPAGAVNCIRAFPGRGIRVWGARTLSRNPEWRYVNVRRLFHGLVRWLDRTMAHVAFEPNTPRLWAQVSRELTEYCSGLFQEGALKGESAAGAFFVVCNETTNPPDSRRDGRLVAEVGLAPSHPYEYVVLRLVLRQTGVNVAAAKANL